MDYQKANFIHADLSPEGMKKAMKERGDDETTIVLGVIADFLRKKNLDADKPEPQAPDISLTDLLNPKKFKRMMAQSKMLAAMSASAGRSTDCSWRTAIRRASRFSSSS